MLGSKTGNAQGVFIISAYKATTRTRLTSLTWVPARSSSTGIRSRSSLSWASENQLLIGTACCGWKMYDVGELSMMMVSLRSRPICERSCLVLVTNGEKGRRTNLDVVALVVVTAFTEKSVVHDVVDIELVQEWVAVLSMLA